MLRGWIPSQAIASFIPRSDKMKLPAILAATMLMTPLVVASQAAPLRGPTYEAARYGIATPPVDRMPSSMETVQRRHSGWVVGGAVGGVVGALLSVGLIAATDRENDSKDGPYLTGALGGAFVGFVFGSLIGHAVGKD